MLLGNDLLGLGVAAPATAAGVPGTAVAVPLMAGGRVGVRAPRQARHVVRLLFAETARYRVADHEPR